LLLAERCTVGETSSDCPAIADASGLSLFIRVSDGPADLLGDEARGDDELGALTARDLSPDGLTRENDGFGGGAIRLQSKIDLFVETDGFATDIMAADASAGCEME